MHTPIINDATIHAIGERYQLELIDPDDAMHYKLCQIILMLEQKLGIVPIKQAEPEED